MINAVSVVSVSIYSKRHKIPEIIRISDIKIINGNTALNIKTLISLITFLINSDEFF